MEFSENSKKFIYVEPDANKSCLEILIESKVSIPHSCGGNGTCGTCKVIVDNSYLKNASQTNSIEAELAKDRGFKSNERLSCQLYLLGPLKLSFEE